MRKRDKLKILIEQHLLNPVQSATPVRPDPGQNSTPVDMLALNRQRRSNLVGGGMLYD
jgi:hypothetical protein